MDAERAALYTARPRRGKLPTLHGGAAALAAVLLCAGPLAGSAWSAETACVAATAAANVVAVPDARTLALVDARLLRLAGIEPFSLLLSDSDAEGDLKSRLTALLAGRNVRLALASEKPDRHGRLPTLVYLGGALVQEKLAREGLAIAFAGGDALPCFDRILAAEADARRAHRGFWAKSVAVLDARPPALAPRIGHFAIFEGRIVSVANRRATTYLDFGTLWSKDVTIEIAAAAREAFGGEPGLEKLAGAQIRARGFIVEKGGPMLAVSSPMQIEILETARADDRIAP